jgi:hypothetical protein
VSGGTDFSQVILKFLARIDIETETVQDGVQATDTIFSKEPGYYSIVLVGAKTRSHHHMLTFTVRFAYAQQRRVPSLQRDPTMGEEARVPSPPNHRAFCQRSRRRIRKVRGSGLQFLCHEACRVQRTFYRHDEVPGSGRSIERACSHEEEVVRTSPLPFTHVHIYTKRRSLVLLLLTSAIGAVRDTTHILNTAHTSGRTGLVMVHIQQSHNMCISIPCDFSRIYYSTTFFFCMRVVLGEVIPGMSAWAFSRRMVT